RSSQYRQLARPRARRDTRTKAARPGSQIAPTTGSNARGSSPWATNRAARRPPETRSATHQRRNAGRFHRRTVTAGLSVGLSSMRFTRRIQEVGQHADLAASWYRLRGSSTNAAVATRGLSDDRDRMAERLSQGTTRRVVGPGARMACFNLAYAK